MCEDMHKQARANEDESRKLCIDSFRGNVAQANECITYCWSRPADQPLVCVGQAIESFRAQRAARINDFVSVSAIVIASALLAWALWRIRRDAKDEVS